MNITKNTIGKRHRSVENCGVFSLLQFFGGSEMRKKEQIRRSRGGQFLLLAGMGAFLLTGCSRIPGTLAGTAWKVTELKASDGTVYDESAYDALIGATYYRFGEEGGMSCQVGQDPEDTSTYRYAYEKGVLKISSDQLVCTGEAKRGKIQLALGEGSYAVLTELAEEKV